MTNIDFTQYTSENWGISIKGLKELLLVLDTLEEVHAIEFGSGVSTQFLVDYAAATRKTLYLDSFDNDPKYKHDKAQLVELIHCNDRAYQSMFSQRAIDWSLFKKKLWRPKTSQKNCFYRIDESTLRRNYNLAIIDGPHGNGRNFAFLLLKKRINNGYIFIDDFNHYDFLEKAYSIFHLEEISRNEQQGDNFVLVKVLGEQ